MQLVLGDDRSQPYHQAASPRVIAQVLIEPCDEARTNCLLLQQSNVFLDDLTDVSHHLFDSFANDHLPNVAQVARVCQYKRRTDLISKLKHIRQQLPSSLVHSNLALDDLLEDISPVIQLFFCLNRWLLITFFLERLVCFFRQAAHWLCRDRCWHIERHAYAVSGLLCERTALVRCPVDLSQGATVPIVVPTHEVTQKVNILSTQVLDSDWVIWRKFIHGWQFWIAQHSLEEFLE